MKKKKQKQKFRSDQETAERKKDMRDRHTQLDRKLVRSDLMISQFQKG